MKRKLIKTLIAIGLALAAVNVVDSSEEVIGKYASLTQFDNSETNYQLQRNVQNISYLNYFIMVFAAFYIWEIWAPKEKISAQAES